MGSDFRRYFLPISALAIGAGAAITVICNSQNAVFMVAVAAAIVMPLATIIIAGRRDAFSPLVIAAVVYILVFGVGAIYYYVNNEPRTDTLTHIFYLYDRKHLTQTVALGAVGWLALVFGYCSRPFKWLLGIIPSVPRLPTGRSLATAGTLAYIVGWGGRLMLIAFGRYLHYGGYSATASTGGSWPIYALSRLPLFIALLALAVYWANGGVSRRTVTALMLVELAWAIPTGGRRDIANVLLGGLVVCYYARASGVPKRTIIALVLVFTFIFSPLALNYRHSSDYHTNTTHALSEASSQLFSQSPPDFIVSGLNATVARFSESAAMAMMLDRGPRALNLPRGQTLLWTVESFVPRALAPNKVDPGTFGNLYGRTYGLLSNKDFRTSIATPPVDEFYFNFEIPGVLIGMFLLGGVYRLISDYLAGRRANPLVLAVYALLAWPLVESQETIIAQGLFGAIKLGVVLVIILAVMIGFTSRKPIAAAIPTLVPDG
jgi:hypothetical protein